MKTTSDTIKSGKTLAERLNDAELMCYDSMTEEELEAVISKEIVAIRKSIDNVRKYAASAVVIIEVNNNDTIEKQLRLLHPAASVLLQICNIMGRFRDMLDWYRSTADGMSSMLKDYRYFLYKSISCIFDINEKNQTFTFKSMFDYLGLIKPWLEYFFNEEDIEEREIKIYSDNRITIQFPNKALFNWMVDIFTITEESDTEKILAEMNNSLLDRIVDKIEKGVLKSLSSVQYDSMREVFKEVGVDYYSSVRNNYLISKKEAEIVAQAKKKLKRKAEKNVKSLSSR